MGRAPCCDKANVKKGPWSPEEDAKLKSYIEQHGTGGNWIALPQKIGLKRCGKSCRLRWLNYLRPNIRHGGFSEEEDNIICSLYISIGSRWSVIAAQLPGRTDNDIKNYWNTRLKKKLLGKQRKEQQARRGSCPKQEMKRASGNAMVSDNENLNPYWPELPVPAPIPYPNEEPRFNDHSSIRRLLIRLGGRFSDDGQPLQNGTNLQLPIDISSVQQPFDHSVNFLSSSPMNALNNPRSEFPNAEYNMEGGGLHMLQGQNSFLAELEEMACSNPQRLDGLEFLYAQDMANNKPGSTAYEQSLSWGETSSLVYPPVASNYEGLQQQGVTQEHDFDELRYPTPR
ncbi:hypothetical protein VitviT2T_027399 [Vitis vinifera]|uniref:Transcription factor RAX3 n=2 Tax=Vitis vinifera TaxID=29760 RepID=A0A438F8Q3_VITVI|eukprot:XP_019071830.1 PREDICTED: transcription factor RAX3 [Vitis vinifera]